MTRQQAIKNINAQPVGRATLIVNDKCGDPTNYLYKINCLALHNPREVRAIAIAIVNDESVTKAIARDLVDTYYERHLNRSKK
jgi:hypothetical protein